MALGHTHDPPEQHTADCGPQHALREWPPWETASTAAPPVDEDFWRTFGGER